MIGYIALEVIFAFDTRKLAADFAVLAVCVVEAGTAQGGFAFTVLTRWTLRVFATPRAASFGRSVADLAFETFTVFEAVEACLVATDLSTRTMSCLCTLFAEGCFCIADLICFAFEISAAAYATEGCVCVADLARGTFVILTTTGAGVVFAEFSCRAILSIQTIASFTELADAD